MHFSREKVIIICSLAASLGLLALAANFILARALPPAVILKRILPPVILKLILPSTKENDVPFTSQAPEGDWREPWQSACEEASIVMIQNFYKDKGLTVEQARQQILAVFQLKKETAPASQDESLERIAEIINSGNLIWQAHVVNDPSLTTIKDELAANHPIIAPVYAPLLHNPNYTSPGPSYHVIVITGYDDASGEFITNDPGTDKGKDNRYPYQVLLTAVHDYLANKDYTAGIKRLLFTELR